MLAQTVVKIMKALCEVWEQNLVTLFYQRYDQKSQKGEKKSLKDELNKAESQSITDHFFFPGGGGDTVEGELIPFSGNTKKSIGKERHLLAKENIDWQEMKWDN